MVKRRGYCNRTKALLSLAAAAVLIGIVVLASKAAAGQFEYGRLRFFDEGLPAGASVAAWSESKKDATLHTLSHWGFSADGWREFVKHSVSGLALPPASSSKPFAFLEVGVGVGAFTRTLLAQYPAATAVGVDLSPAAVKVARAVLPAHRAQVHVSDATNLGCLDDNVFDFVVVPGAICYLSTYAAILAALREIARVARPRARISATMIPQGLRGMASCTTYIPKEWWASEDVRRLGFRVLEMQEMSSWSSADNAIHGEGRYAVFLQLNKITPPPAA